jgi:hypothetical protein
MRETSNGMSAADLEGVVWRKSRLSNSQGACVEMARLPGGEVAVRNSRDPDGPALIYPAAAIRALLDGARDGDLDSLLSLSGLPASLT